MRRFSSAYFYLFTLLTSALAIVLTQSAQAQTFQVIFRNSGNANLTMDRAGNFYGTTYAGGKVFKLEHKGSGWVYIQLTGLGDTYAPLTIGSNGSLYSTTSPQGGGGGVFNLKPPPRAPPSVFGGWTETELYGFTGGSDGANPYSDVIFDQAGNLYGTTWGGGGGGSCSGVGCGAVYKLTPSNGSWTESVIHGFTEGGDGQHPWSGVIFDQSGNLYGATVLGGAYGYGAVYQLTPSGSGWTETILYSFTGGMDGANPQAGLIFDQAGNLYGATIGGGSGNGGTVFELTPSNGSWTESLLYAFNGCAACGPTASLVMDAAGNLYGETALDGAYGLGSVFHLTASDDGTWTYTALHDFTGGSDGANPVGNVTLDASGNLYGTTSKGGLYGVGTVWEITPN